MNKRYRDICGWDDHLYALSGKYGKALKKEAKKEEERRILSGFYDRLEPEPVRVTLRDLFRVLFGI